MMITSLDSLSLSLSLSLSPTYTEVHRIYSQPVSRRGPLKVMVGKR